MPILFANDADLNGHKVVNLDDGTDPADGVNRSQLDANSTDDRNRANHTGTQLAATISNFDAAVQTNALDEMAAPTGPVNFNAQELENVATPSTGTSAANKSYVDNAVSAVTGGLQFKGAADVLHTGANINVAAPASATFDGLTVATGQTVILDSQTTGSQDGPWVFNGTGVAMTRPANFSDTTANVYVGSFWVVKRGTGADQFAVMTNDTFTLGTDEADFILRGAGGTSDDDTAYAANVGTGSAGPYTVTHSLGSTDVQVQVRELAGGYIKLVSWRPTDANTVSLEPDETWASNSHRVVVQKVV